MKHFWKFMNHLILVAIMLDAFGRYILFDAQPSQIQLLISVFLFGQIILNKLEEK